jgi:uncharacterized protein YbjQ (UPF0145 family)
MMAASTARVAEAIRSGAQEILERWEAEVQRQLDGAERIPQPLLRDHVPTLLEWVAEGSTSGARRALEPPPLRPPSARFGPFERPATPLLATTVLTPAPACQIPCNGNESPGDTGIETPHHATLRDTFVAMQGEVLIAQDGEAHGPFTSAELAELWDAGEIHPQALYWHRGLTGWRPTAEFRPPSAAELATPAAWIRLSTTPEIPGETIAREIQVLHAEVVHGVSFVSEVAAGFKDLTGGRSKRLESILASAHETAFAELRQRAHGCRADAVIGVSTQLAEVSGKGALMFAVTVTGTAVRLEVQPPPVPEP